MAQHSDATKLCYAHGESMAQKVPRRSMMGSCAFKVLSWCLVGSIDGSWWILGGSMVGLWRVQGGSIVPYCSRPNVLCGESEVGPWWVHDGGSMVPP